MMRHETAGFSTTYQINYFKFLISIWAMRHSVLEEGKKDVELFWSGMGIPVFLSHRGRHKLISINNCKKQVLLLTGALGG